MSLNEMSDNELNLLRLKQEEKLERYLKLFNEATERTIEYILQIEEEMQDLRRNAVEESKRRGSAHFFKSSYLG